LTKTSKNRPAINVKASFLKIKISGKATTQKVTMRFPSPDENIVLLENTTDKIAMAERIANLIP
jgi:hypothetical protein